MESTTSKCVMVLDENLPERVAAVPDPAFMQMLKRELTAVRRLLAGRL